MSHSRRRLPLALLISAGLASTGCTGGTNDAVGERVRFDFGGEDPGGWEAGFADVAVVQSTDVGFVADHRALPAPLLGNGLYQRGMNLSDDLCMWFTHRRGGFEPGTTFAVSLDVGIASDAGLGCDAGIAASTYVKVGVAPHAPLAVERDGYLRMNVDKGTPGGDGTEAVTVGDLRNGLPGCPSSPPWAARSLGSAGREVTVTTGPDGVLWFYVITDSAWEGPYSLYVTHLEARVRKVTAP